MRLKKYLSKERLKDNMSKAGIDYDEEGKRLVRRHKKIGKLYKAFKM